ncbi:MAG TPA: alpha/beta hydrolase [Phenylobacterium sp.]|jgi:acetyl esterase|uniref:alpha/beta hydrolase n=1 Tax=Phenylobacterium sp. TaxID=1871053 RepID=UPI002CE75455|nr:alpha/beta hydrolase [Phenylobacterium sp.]HXA41269.1 alpha/beta hydrolase [Phenylobacterium sp.]
MSVLDADFAAMLDAQAEALKAQPMPPLDALPPEMVRAGYRLQRQAQDQNAPRDVETRDLTVAQTIPARLYRPAGLGDPSGLLVYFHGGGFVIGDLETHDGHCRRLAKGGACRVLAVDYRLAPEHPFPAGHDDALAATKWAFDNASDLGVDPRRIAVGGDSAGGNLAASVALDLKDDPERQIAFQLLLYPGIWPEAETASRKALDGPVLTRASLDWFEKLLAAVGHPHAHRAMLGRRDLKGAAPALVVTAGFDPLKDEGRDFAERLKASGVAATHVEHPTLVHDFYIMHDVSPAVATAAAETAAALKAALS